MPAIRRRGDAGFAETAPLIAAPQCKSRGKRLQELPRMHPLHVGTVAQSRPAVSLSTRHVEKTGEWHKGCTALRAEREFRGTETMNTRACCIALMVAAGVASPCGSGESNAEERDVLAARSMTADLAVSNAPGQWTDPQWQLAEQMLEPPLQNVQRRSRNPAGRLLLPAPQTSHAPAF